MLEFLVLGSGWHLSASQFGVLLPPLTSLLYSLQFDVTYPHLACSILSLDAMDVSGEQHLDVVS